MEACRSKTELQSVARIVSSEEALRVLHALGTFQYKSALITAIRQAILTTVLLTRLIGLSGCILATLLMMLPNALPQLQQRVRTLEFEARMPTRLQFVRPKSDVYLLSRFTNVEPGQTRFLKLRHWSAFEAERLAVEGVGLLEGACRDCEIDVCDARDHCWWFGGAHVVGAVGLFRTGRRGSLNEISWRGCDVFGVCTYVADALSADIMASKAATTAFVHVSAFAAKSFFNSSHIYGFDTDINCLLLRSSHTEGTWKGKAVKGSTATISIVVLHHH